jgi:sugar/nucleoside kinase (ribokinase family)
MKRVLVLGGVSYNTMIYVDSFPQPEPQTVFSKRLHDTVGSTGSGKALNLCRLGFDVTLHGVIGDDRYGDLIKAYFDGEDLRFIYDINPVGTERHTNLMDVEGRRISIIQVQREPNASQPDQDKIEPLIGQSDYVALNITSPYSSLIPLIKSHGKEIWCDLHDYDGVNRYHDPFVQGADYLFLSSDLMPDYRAFMERMLKDGKKLVVCTHGKRGSTALTGDGRWVDMPAIDQPLLVDTNGAGDAFFAGFLYGYAQGYDVEVALRYATIAGGLCTSSEELAFPQLSVEFIEAEYHTHYRGEWRQHEKEA